MKTLPNARLVGISTAVAALILFAVPAVADWKPIGPAPIDGFFPGGVSGRATAIAVNPQNWDQVFIGTASGGIWHSPDRGVSWIPLSDDTEALAIGDIELAGCDQYRCSKIYAGTGENAIRRDTYYGIGILIGTISTTNPLKYNWLWRDPYPNIDFFFGSVNDIIRAPISGRLYITYSSGVTVSSSEATVTAPVALLTGYGVFYTDDEGITWTKMDFPGVSGEKPTDLEMDPDDEQTLYAGIMGKGVFKTENGGTDWCPLNAGTAAPGCPTLGVPLPDPAQLTFDHVEIALYPADSNRLYATLGHCPDRLIQRCLPSVYKSDSAGISWAQKMAGSTGEGGLDGWKELPYGYSRYTHALAVDPTNHTRLWMGGLRIFLSNTSGANWSLLDQATSPGYSTWGKIVHLDHRDLVINPANSLQMYNTNDGGFYASETSGVSWTARNDGLQITGFQSIATSPSTNVVIGGTQDNSAAMWTGTDVWQSMPCCGDSGFTVIDAANPDLMYAGTNFGKVTRSIDGGKTWCDAMNGVTPQRRAFYAPIVQDPTPPHDLYYGATRLYRGQATGPGCGDFSWTPISPYVPYTLNDEIVGAGNVITAITVAPSNQNRIFYGMYEGGIFHTDAACTGSECWTQSIVGLPFPITRIAVDPADPDRAWASVASFGNNALYRTLDLSQGLWTTVNGMPPRTPVNTVHFKPGTTDTLWVGTDGNVDRETILRSPDGGLTWAPQNAGLPNVPVYEIAFVPGTSRILAATHGRGVWSLGGHLMMPVGNWIQRALIRQWVWGSDFPPNEECTVELLLADGTACAGGSEDAMGGAIFTNASGVLVTSKDPLWAERPGVYACVGGICAGDVPVDSCNDEANPPSQIVVQCGAESTTADIGDMMLKQNPASSQLGIGLSPAAGLAAGEAIAGAGGSFDLTAALHAGDGTTRSLCTVPVAVTAGDDVDDVLHQAMSSINGDASCMEAGVSADLVTGGNMASEDEFERDPTLTLLAPGATGTQLITQIHVAPGQLPGTSFELQSLGLPVHGLAMAPRIRFTTPPGGAAGGQVTVIQETPLGTCAVTVVTLPGETAEEIATRLAAAFDAPGIPGPNPGCPAPENPRGVFQDREDLSFVMPHELEVLLEDDEVGVILGIDDLENSSPGALAVGAPATECTTPAGAQVSLDGSGSSDPDSSAGTNDDIVSFEWYEGYGSAAETLLGSGELFATQLAIGSHQITLLVTDTGALTSTDTITVSVVDTTAPMLSGSISPNSLWPPNHGMVPVSVTVTATDLCTVDSDVLLILNTALSDEPDDAPGSSDGATIDDIRNAALGTLDVDVKLRAERDSNGTGRTYTLTYKATDLALNSSDIPLTVFVPLAIGGVTEPVIVIVEASPLGTVLYWSANENADGYDVVRGELDNLMDTGEWYEMGSVLCIEAGSTDTNTEGNEDFGIPPSGEAWFYVIESANGYRTGFGTMTADRERLTTSLGGCSIPP